MQIRRLTTITATLLALAGCGGGGGGGGSAGTAAGSPQAPPASGVAGASGVGGAATVGATGSGYSAAPDAGGPAAWTAAGGAAGVPGAPQISGTPSTRVAVNDDYVFVPVASDPDGDPLQFSATQLPAWAGLDPGTGRISGRPRPGDQGNYGPITLVATDGVHRVALTPFTITVAPPGVGLARRPVTLSWRPPDRNEDGSPVGRPPTYRIHYGRQSQAYDQVVALQNPGANRHTFTDLEPGTWYLAMTSVSEDGLESEFSAETVAVVN